MIIALAVSSGFRMEVRRGLSDICGDVQLIPQNADQFDGQSSMTASVSYLPRIEGLEAIEEDRPVIYRSGIV